MQHDGVCGRIDRLRRAHRLAGRVGAMHAGHGDRALSGLSIIDGDDAPPIDAPGHLVLILAGGDTSIAFDAALGVTEEFHARHESRGPYAAVIWQRPVLGSCMPVAGSYP